MFQITVTFGDLRRRLPHFQGMKLPDMLSAFVKSTDEKITRRVTCTYSESNSIIRKTENIAPNLNIVLRYRMVDYKEHSHVFFDVKKQRSLEKLKEQLSRQDDGEDGLRHGDGDGGVLRNEGTYKERLRGIRLLQTSVPS